MLVKPTVRPCGGLQLRCFTMSIFHLSVQPISRREGRSAIAAAAYRAGVALLDERTGEQHDFTKKGGIESAAIFAPADAPEWAQDRQKLWAAAEAAEKRKDACTAHEIVVAIPHELDIDQQRALVHDFATHLQGMTGGVVDVALHVPEQRKKRRRRKGAEAEEWRTDEDGDQRNVHAHIMLTERAITPEGFSTKKHGLWQGRAGNETTQKLRETWAQLCNARLDPEHHIDHRSHAERGISTPPTQHDGWRVTKARRQLARSKRLAGEAEKALAEAIAMQPTPTAPVTTVIEQHPAAAAALASSTASAAVDTRPAPSRLLPVLGFDVPDAPSPFTRRPTKAKDEDKDEDAARAAVLAAMRQQQEPPAQPAGGMTTEELFNLGQTDDEPPPPPPAPRRGREGPAP